jgi:uncharacterized protein (DUF1330 family)
VGLRARLRAVPKAYAIADITVTDPERYAPYREMSTSAAQRYGGRFVVRGGQVDVLEGDRQPDRVVVIEFDDMEAARRWYDSPEYQEAKAVRQSASTGSLVLVEGA